MEPVPGYKAASWSKGYGDFVMKPDLSTIRRIPWLEKTALVLCDVLDHHTHDDLPHSPRAILRKQVKRLQERGYLAYFASELEFYLFNETYDSRARQALAGPRHRLALYRRLPDRHHHQGRGRHAPAAQRDGGGRHPDRELQGRMGTGPGRDQRPLRRSAGNGRPPRHPEERRQGDRRPARARRSPSWRSTITAWPAIPATSTIRCGAPTARRRCSSTRRPTGR